MRLHSVRPFRTGYCSKRVELVQVGFLPSPASFNFEVVPKVIDYLDFHLHS